MSTRKCQYRTALELFPKIGSKATPTQIDKHVGGTGSYYSKRICYLRIWGFEFDVEKEGRKIVSYTLIKEPANAATYRTGVSEKAKVKAKTKVKTKVVAPKVEAKKDDVKSKNLAKIKAVAEKRKEEKVAVVETLVTAPVPTSFSVDPDWDSVDEVNIAALV